MRWRGLLLLVLAVGALLAGLWLTRDKGEQPQQVQEPLLGTRRLSEARRIVIRNQPEVAPLVIEQEAGGRFILAEPVRDDLSEGWLRALLQSWDTAMVHRVFAPAEVDAALLRETGLAVPPAMVRAEFEDGGETALELGEIGPLGHLYVRRDGGIYYAPADLLSSIQGTPDDLREHLVFRNRPQEVQRFVLRRKLADDREETLAIELGRDGYRLVEPVAVPASDPAARALLAQMLGLRLESFLSGNVGEEPQAADFTLEVDGERGPERVRLWSRPDQPLVGVHDGRGIAFTLPRRIEQGPFAITAEDLRTRVVIPFRVEQMQRLKLDPGARRGAALVLVRDQANELRLAQPVAAATNPGAIAALMQALRRLGAVEFVGPTPADLAPLGLAEPSLTLAIDGSMPQESASLRFGADVAPAGGGDKVLTYAQVVGDELIVKVPKEAVDALRIAWHELVALQVYRNEARGEIGRVIYRRGEKTAAYVRGEDGNWRREGEAAVLARLAEVVTELCDLRAQRAVAETEVPGEGAIEVVLQRPNGDELRTLTLVPTGDRLYARQDRLAVWFELSSLVREGLLAPVPQ
jgi:hypothetical protein